MSCVGYLCEGHLMFLLLAPFPLTLTITIQMLIYILSLSLSSLVFGHIYRSCRSNINCIPFQFDAKWSQSTHTHMHTHLPDCKERNSTDNRLIYCIYSDSWGTQLFSARTCRSWCSFSNALIYTPPNNLDCIRHQSIWLWLHFRKRENGSNRIESSLWWWQRKMEGRTDWLEKMILKL